MCTGEERRDRNILEEYNFFFIGTYIVKVFLNHYANIT